MPNPNPEQTISSDLKSSNKGMILKKAREAQGLSLDSVHETTKIPMDILRAVEEGYTVRTMSPFYYRGFLKIYAKYLNIDLKEFLENYQEPSWPKPIKFVKKEEPKFDIDIQRLFFQFFTRERKRQIVIGAGIVLALFLTGKVFVFIGKAISAGKEKALLTKEINVPKKKEPPVKIAAAPHPENKAKTEVPAAQTAKGVILTARAKKDCWLRVKVDGRIVFQSTLAAGVSEIWRADDQVEISGKNLNQLEFELNGRTIGSLGRVDSKAKAIVVTKDGLSVTK